MDPTRSAQTDADTGQRVGVRWFSNGFVECTGYVQYGQVIREKMGKICGTVRPTMSTQE